MVWGMQRPVIGLCTALERARWSVWDQEAVLLPRNYVEEVARAGGLPVLLPPDAQSVDEPDETIGLLDGLLLAGGADIDPASYGQTPHAETQDSVPERDAFEIALTRAAIERELPVLGICRGMQLINVALGGTLDQHLPESIGDGRHRSTAGSFGTHRVRLAEGTLACEAAGTDGLLVMSHHHQGVDRLGEGLAVSGWSVDDDIVEAIELPDRSFALGVVWHPEEDETSEIIPALVAAARSATSGEGDSPPAVPYAPVGLKRNSR